MMEKAMFKRRQQILMLGGVLSVCGISLVPQLAEAAAQRGATERAEHAIAGEIKKVDHSAKTLLIRTAEGTEETVKYTERSAVHGLKDVARVADAGAKAGLEGTSAVIRYTGQGADRTVVSVEHIPRHTLSLAKGTVLRIDKAGKFVVLKTEAGAEETFQISKDAVVDTGHGVEAAGAATGRAIIQGAAVIVHYSESGSQKVAHLLKNL
jgi:arginine repressor